MSLELISFSADIEAELAKQYHSITIGDKNTWRDFRLIPSSRPTIASPEVKTTFVEVPGADGQLDFTEALDNKIHYGVREGSWERKQIILLDEMDAYPNQYWTGRIMLNEFASDEHHSKVTINYVIDPFRSEGGEMKGTFI